jgi:hypothetical protein
MKYIRGGAVMVVAVVLLGGCSQRYGAEQDGRKLGEAVCDLRDAQNADEAQNAVSDIKEQLDDLAGKYSMFTSEDRSDIDDNLADLAEHAVQGNEALLQQDLKVLRRSAGNIDEDVDEISHAAWEGFYQGLSECT